MRKFEFVIGKRGFIRLLLVSILLTISIAIGACGGADMPQPEAGVDAESESLAMLRRGRQAPDEEAPGAMQSEGLPKETELRQDEGWSAEIEAGDEPAVALEAPPVTANSEGNPTPVEGEKPATVEIAKEAEVTVDLPVEPRVGALAPDFTLQTVNGDTIRLSDLRGRQVLVSYWASWCLPCLNEMRILEQLYKDYQAQGVMIVSVNAIEQDSLDKVMNTVNDVGVTYPVLLDQDNQFAREYSALFFPTTFFVDEDGVIRDIALGDSPEADFRVRVEQFIQGDF